MKLAVAFVFGLAGGLAGALVLRALDDRPSERAGAPQRAPAIDEDAIARIVAAEIERQLPARAAAAEPSAPERAAAPRIPEGVGHGEGAEPAEDKDHPDIDEVVRGLKGKRLASDDYDRLFSWLTSHPTRISDVIAAIQKEIQSDPSNPDLQVALAMAYVGELWNNTPDGPQRGMVWMKAAAAYDAAIKLEPEHWHARFGKAFGTSMAPEAFGMRPAAIRQFEELLEIQKRKAPEPQYADTYFRLGTLYKDAGNIEKARELWAEGLRLFPDNEELKGTIEASTKK